MTQKVRKTKFIQWKNGCMTPKPLGSPSLIQIYNIQPLLAWAIKTTKVNTVQLLIWLGWAVNYCVKHTATLRYWSMLIHFQSLGNSTIANVCLSVNSCVINPHQSFHTSSFILHFATLKLFSLFRLDLRLRDAMRHKRQERHKTHNMRHTITRFQLYNCRKCSSSWIIQWKPTKLQPFQI